MSLKDKKEKKSRAKEWAERESAGFAPTAIDIPESNQRFRLEDRTYRIDILPYKVGDNKKFIEKLRHADKDETHWVQTYFSHGGLGLSGKESYVCLEQTFGKKCPVCEYLRSGKASEEVENRLRAKKRILLNVLDTENKNKGVQVWDVSVGGKKNPWFGQLLINKISSLEDYHYFDELSKKEGGKTLLLAVEKDAQFGNKVINIEMIPKASDYKSSIMEKCAVLDQIVIELSYKELYEKLHPGESDESGGGEDEAEAGVTSSGSSIDDDLATDEDKEKDTDDEDEDAEKSEDDSDLEPATEDDSDVEKDDEEEKDDSEDEDTDKDAEDEDEEKDDEEPEDVKKPDAKKDKKSTENGKASPAFRVGMEVGHAKYGRCEVLEGPAKDGTYVLEDKNGKEHSKIKAADLLVLKKAEPAKKTGKK